MTNLSESVCRVCGQEEDLLRHDRYGEATRDCFDHDFDPIFVAAPAATEEPLSVEAAWRPIREMVYHNLYPVPFEDARAAVERAIRDEQDARFAAIDPNAFYLRDLTEASIKIVEQATTIQRLRDVLQYIDDNSDEAHIRGTVVRALADEGGSDGA